MIEVYNEKDPLKKTFKDNCCKNVPVYKLNPWKHFNTIFNINNKHQTKHFLSSSFFRIDGDF